MRQRPIAPELPHLHPEEMAKFREEERAWFEELLASPHVQAVMNIPTDEPIFILRGQDKFAVDAIQYWQVKAARMRVEQDAATHCSDEKIEAAGRHLQLIADWQRDNPERVKVPD